MLRVQVQVQGFTQGLEKVMCKFTPAEAAQKDANIRAGRCASFTCVRAAAFGGLEIVEAAPLVSSNTLQVCRSAQDIAQRFVSGVSERQPLALAVPAAGLRVLLQNSAGLSWSCAVHACRGVCEELRHA